MGVFDRRLWNLPLGSLDWDSFLLSFYDFGVFQGPGQPSQRVFTGTVTKLHDNFGFVDEDVFFQTTVVKGQAPGVNVRLEA